MSLVLSWGGFHDRRYHSHRQIGQQILDNIFDSTEAIRVIVRDPSRLSPRVRKRVEVVQGRMTISLSSPRRSKALTACYGWFPELTCREPHELLPEFHTTGVRGDQEPRR